MKEPAYYATALPPVVQPASAVSPPALADRPICGESGCDRPTIPRARCGPHARYCLEHGSRPERALARIERDLGEVVARAVCAESNLTYEQVRSPGGFDHQQRRRARPKSGKDTAALLADLDATTSSVARGDDGTRKAIGRDMHAILRVASARLLSELETLDPARLATVIRSLSTSIAALGIEEKTAYTSIELVLPRALTEEDVTAMITETEGEGGGEACG